MRVLFAALIGFASVATAEASALVEPLRSGGGGLACTADRVWCVATTGASATVRYRGEAAGTLELESNEDERVASSVWRSIVRVNLPGKPAFALVGVARTQSEAYSGGGGSVTTLTLFEVRPGTHGVLRPVADMPLESSFLIRACFSRADERRRRGACHDEYRFRAALTAAGRDRGGVRLAYTAQAESFPGRRSRFGDSATEGRLRKQDLYWAVDRKCSFKRELVWNAGTGLFAWRAPLPACAEYVELQ